MRLIRTPITWYCYLLSGFFTVMLNIQGNIIPFLREELALSYRAAGLHPSAIAAGMIVAGVVTERVLAALGRRAALQVAVGGSLAGMLLLGLATSAVVSVGGCLLVGLTGAMIPGIVAGLLARLHGPTRDQAYAECGAITYACAMVANFAVAGCVAVGLGWRGGLLLGAAFGIAVVLTLGRRPIPNAPPRMARSRGGTLPPACVAYLVTLGFGVALEFSVLLWSPAFLEHVVGLGASVAAACSAAFSAAMLLGRWAGSLLVRVLPPVLLYPAALALVAPGFALYWGVATPIAAVVGLFVLGLAVALLYPLSLGLLIAAAGAAADIAGARTAFAAGTALLLSPLVLGTLADAVGLYAAHLVIPVIVVAIVLCFTLARVLERRAAIYGAAAPSHD
jgi:predicted MFS family arabinose efflux permease